MFNRIINWVKSKFHVETPEEQDKRIHETIKSWKENVDKEEIERILEYKSYCREELLMTRNMVGQQEIPVRHLELWNEIFPQIKNLDNALKVWTDWHEAHVFLSALYCFDVTYPPDDPRFGQIKEHFDIRPAKWLKDLANEEKIIKALQMKANANQWTVRSEDIKECEDEYKKSLNMH